MYFHNDNFRTGTKTAAKFPGNGSQLRSQSSVGPQSVCVVCLSD
jgi:hypothetical protein